MAVNVFEGARRITKLMLAIWVIGWTVIVVDSIPAVPIAYSVSDPVSPPVRLDADPRCDGGSREDWRTGTTPGGTDYSLTVCFQSREFDSGGEPLVPFKVEPDGTLWGHDAYSTEVSDYIKQQMDGWRFPDADLKWLDSQRWRTRVEHLKDAVPWLIGGVAAIWGLSALIGWIVRGFLGIPSGQDRRVSREEAQ